MIKYLPALLIVLLLLHCQPHQTQVEKTWPTEGPIQLHPENPHYFLYKGKTLALITSAEHYGAVLNLDFDYKKYLNTLAEDGMNYTRIFTGAYFEIAGESFGIQNNTLAPLPGRVITPWAEITDPSGEKKYDLETRNTAYFQRLRDFINLAESLDIIVEVTLFSSIYRDAHWDISPQNPANNINISHEVTRHDAQTLNNSELFEYQANMVSKFVAELNGYDNFFFEIQNEPWSDHQVPVYNIVNKEELDAGDWTYKSDFADQAAMDWQEKLAEIIVEQEAKLPKKHLIAQNYTNFRAPIPEVTENISIINFHYAWPHAVEWNYHYNKVIGFDESGFAGSDDPTYRRQAWRFMLSGGGLFNNLDYSFYVGHEDGLGENDAPGGGSATLRKQLKILSDFLNGFALEQLHPSPSSVVKSPGLIPYVMSDSDGAYAIYLRAIGTDIAELELITGVGSFLVILLDPVSGTYSELGTMEASDGRLEINIDIPDGELALRIVRR